MPLSRVPRSPDLERVVQVLGGRVVEEGASPRRGGGWVPAPPGVVEGPTRQPEPDLRGLVELGPNSADLEDQLRRARRPSLVSVPASLRTGRVSVSSSAVVAVLALVVALGCAFVLRILWAERAAESEVAPAAEVAGGTRRVSVGGSERSDRPSGPATPVVVSRSGPATGAGAPAQAELVVHVVGQVARPGLVRLAAGARVADAIEAAGGAGRSADLTAMNLARALVDGEQVFVPKPGEEPPALVAPQLPGGATAGNGTGSVGGSATGLVNLNTADLDALDSLPGVGPVLAQRIVDWRTEHGRFTTVEELGEVSGIGDKMLSQLRPRVTV
jgi:competence protein ComEA